MPRHVYRLWWIAVLICLTWPASISAPAADPPAAAGQDGYAQVTGPCDYSFPADHGPHPAYRTEWWYYTGNLTTAGGRRFGFQLTFFRRRLSPPDGRSDWPKPASAWRSDQIYLAHAALTDIEGRRHFQAEKMARPVLSLAGAEPAGKTWKIYLHAWQAVIGPDTQHLRAEAGDFSLALALKPVKPVVAHGENGYSRKGRTPERASCYYSFTRLEADGVLALDGDRHAVSGAAWMDHEFSSAALEPGTTGWDWFSLQLCDGAEIMIFLLRQRDGGRNPASSGTYVPPAGQALHLGAGALRVEPLAYWTSPRSGARYPIRWKLTVDAGPVRYALEVSAGLADQEMHTPGSTGVTYWEGIVRASGFRDAGPVEGLGYVEMTGYAEPFDTPL